ncbi:MAG: hypothetical protein ACI4L8_06005 [Candidatus Fimadaptatus sp.]
MRRSIMAVLLVLAMTCACAGAEPEAVVGPLAASSLEELFSYRECLNPEIAQQPGFDKDDLEYETPAASAAYCARLMAHVETLESVQEQGELRMTARRALAVNSLCALEWTIENIGDEPLLLDYGMMETNGEVGAVSAFGGGNMVLLPGEYVECAAANMTPGLSGAECEIRLHYATYRLPAGKVPKDRSAELYPDEADIGPVGEYEFALTVPRSAERVMSALAQGETRDYEWQGSTLRLTEARQSISDGSYTVLRIFDTREEALAHDPGSDDWWDVQFYTELTDEGSAWVKVGGGSMDDEPFELEDGRWAYSITHTAELLNWLPEGRVYMVPWLPGEDGMAVPQWDSAVELAMTHEPEEPAGAR